LFRQHKIHLRAGQRDLSAFASWEKMECKFTEQYPFSAISGDVFWLVIFPCCFIPYFHVHVIDFFNCRNRLHEGQDTKGPAI
jgi:hypothetical protein